MFNDSIPGQVTSLETAQDTPVYTSLVVRFVFCSSVLLFCVCVLCVMNATSKNEEETILFFPFFRQRLSSCCIFFFFFYKQHKE